MKKLSTLLQVICIGLVAMSCGSDDPAKLTKEDAVAAFGTANTSVATDLADMMEAPGYTAMNSLSSLSGAPIPFGRIRSFEHKEVKGQLQQGLYAFRSILTSSTVNARVSGDEAFDFSGSTGVYTYNFETSQFDFTDGGTIIEIRYPSSDAAKANSDNDAVFKLNDYDEEYTPYGDDLYSPTIIKATIHIDGTLQAEIDLDVDYDDATDEMEKADIYLYLNPFSLDFSFDDTRTTVTSISADLSKNNENVIGGGVTVTFYTADKEDPKAISGYIQLANVRFVFSANAESGNSDDINDYVSIVISVDGAIAGRVVFVEDEFGEPIPYVRYNDGTEVLLSSVFAELEEEVNIILGS